MNLRNNKKNFKEKRTQKAEDDSQNLEFDFPVPGKFKSIWSDFTSDVLF